MKLKKAVANCTVFILSLDISKYPLSVSKTDKRVYKSRILHYVWNSCPYFNDKSDEYKRFLITLYFSVLMKLQTSSHVVKERLDL